ncbi:MAG: acyltransferase [Clostridia bacterium]|nr:acyltransferase [Clostridia bacterium]
MKILKFLYEKLTGKTAPYYFNYSILTIIAKPFRKYFTNVVAAHCPFNCVRIFIYRLCGFKIGKKCFIGMRCYLDDMCHKELIIGNNVTISYGVFFACHGKGQKHLPIVIKDGAYIGMRANLISHNSNPEEGITVGEGAVIGACTLVNKNIPDGATAYGVPCKIKQE